MSNFFAQAGAIPYRITKAEIEVLLISTRSGKHLTIPKGLIDPGFNALETARQETWEEAGVEGELLTAPVGSYRYAKWDGVCEVSVFVMAVSRELDAWPEAALRRRQWLGFPEAARRVRHHDLGDLILKLPAIVA